MSIIYCYHIEVRTPKEKKKMDEFLQETGLAFYDFPTQESSLFEVEAQNEGK